MEGESLKLYCNCCNKQTNHKILKEEQRTYHSEEDDIYLEETYRIVECCGCDNVSFNLETTGSEYVQYGEYGEEQYSDYRAFPIKEGTIHPINSLHIPQIIRRVYLESINAYNNDCPVLATTGLRTTVEAVCKEKKVKGKNLKAMIDNLLKEGFITAADCKRLHEMRFSGNDSVHEMQPLTDEELLLLIDIINNMLSNLYVLDKKFKDTFYYRFETADQFIDLLNQGIQQYSVGSSYVLGAFLPDEYKYRKEDVTRYEIEVIDRINKGKYLKLELDETPEEGHKQKYKVTGN